LPALPRRLPDCRLSGPYKLDARRCISYLTIEHKGPIPHELRPLIGNRIFGCDDCLASARGTNSQAGHEPAFLPRDELTAPRLAELARSTMRGSARCSPAPRSSAPAATGFCAMC
jgi:epoxyqueuosine reductase QueG